MDGNENRLTQGDEMRFAERSMEWYGWGSPVGLGIMLVALAVAAVLVRLAISGF